MTLLNEMLNILGLLRVTPTFHQYVETVSTSHHLAMRTWSPLRHFLVRSFSRFFSWTSAHSSTDSGHADTRYSPTRSLMHALPLRQGVSTALFERAAAYCGCEQEPICETSGGCSWILFSMCGTRADTRSDQSTHSGTDPAQDFTYGSTEERHSPNGRFRGLAVYG